MRSLLAAVVLFAPPALLAQDTKPKQVQTKLTVTVPLEDATLTIEGQKTSQPGTTRLFDTPPLDAGKRFVYRFEVKWEPNNYTKLTRTRTVEFTARRRPGRGPDQGAAGRQGRDPVRADAGRHRWPSCWN